WEVYVLHEDVEHSGFDDPPVTAAPAPRKSWEHRLTEPWPDRLPHADGALDEVRLEGSFNALVGPGPVDALLPAVRQVLLPGGRVAVHGLVADRPFPGAPKLPGLASLVRHVPVETEPLEALKQAGFGGLFYEKLGDVHCFSVGGVELREMRLVGWKAAGGAWPGVVVVYKGPLESVTDEDGLTYRRGEGAVAAGGAAAPGAGGGSVHLPDALTSRRPDVSERLCLLLVAAALLLAPTDARPAAPPARSDSADLAARIDRRLDASFLEDG